MKGLTTAAGIITAGLYLVVLVTPGVSSDRVEGIEGPEKKSVVNATSGPQEGKSGSPSIESEKRSTRNAIEMPVYIPPLRGAPGGRVGGGTRGIEDESISLCVLAPDHTGLTVHEQPCLYWFISKVPTYPIEFTIIERRAVKPVVEKRIRPPQKPGVQCIRLADCGVRLQQNVPYEWFVAIIVDPGRRSKDILAGGVIQQFECPQMLKTKLKQGGKEREPHIFAEAGLWYDALKSISDLIDSSPRDMVLRQERASLLEQVGLSEIAQFEMKQSGSIKK